MGSVNVLGILLKLLYKPNLLTGACFPLLCRAIGVANGGIRTMAYLREIESGCYRCKIARAVVELVDRWNGVRGQYCKKCGALRLKEQKKNEEGS